MKYFFILIPIGIVIGISTVIGRAAIKIDQSEWSLDEYSISKDLDEISIFIPGFSYLSELEGRYLAYRDILKGTHRFLGLGYGGSHLNGANNCVVKIGPTREWLRTFGPETDKEKISPEDIPITRGHAEIECKTPTGEVVQIQTVIREVGCIVTPAIDGFTRGYNKEMKRYFFEKGGTKANRGLTRR